MVSERKYKVAFIHPDLGIGGAERLVLDVAIALVNNGHTVEFVTNHFDKTHSFEELQNDKYPVCVIGDWIPRSICGICQAICAYIRMLYLTIVYLFFTKKDKKPDIYFVDQIPMAVPFIKWSGNKVVYYCHHPDLLASPPGGLLKKIYRAPINWLELQGTSLADTLLVNSKYTASIFRQTFPCINNDIEILYPTISSSYQSKVENRPVKQISELVPEITASNTSVIFLSINRFHPAKNLELALSGLEALKPKVALEVWNSIHLIMCGGFDPQSSVNAKHFAKLVSIAERLGITTKVTFLKSPSDDLKADLLQACDCLIYTPINEHFGIVPLEAMIVKKPVIACNSGGPCETVENNVTGYLCDPNSDSLAECMKKMLDKDACKKMGQLGRERQEKYYSHDTFTSKVNAVITEAAIVKRQPDVINKVEPTTEIPTASNGADPSKINDTVENESLKSENVAEAVENVIKAEEVKPEIEAAKAKDEGEKESVNKSGNGQAQV